MTKKHQSLRASRKKQKYVGYSNKRKGGVKLLQPKIKITSSFLPSRFYIFIAGIIVVFIVIFLRSLYLQQFNADFLNEQADQRSLREQKLVSERGTITDRHGKLLAVSVPMFAVVLDPKIINESQELQTKESHWQLLAKALDTSLHELKKNILRNPEQRFLYAARQVSSTISDYVKTLQLKGVILKPTSRRFYPNSEETAHLLGYTDIDGQGIDGVEKSFNQILQGKSGKRTYRKDVFGKMIEDVEQVPTYNAPTLYLSIDEKIQSMMFETLQKAVELNKAKAGSAVLVDIETGEVIAMASSPSYNPNDRRSMIVENLRNRVITDTFEPGSTVKPFVVLTALENGYVRRDEIIDTMPLTLDGFQVRDVAPRNRQSLDDVLKNSSNRGVSRIALRMPEQMLRQTYKNVGFGEPTKLGLIGETSGKLLMKPQDGRIHWSQIEQATLSYGYGLSVSPLQLARAYATLGSFGIYRPLSITKVDPPVLGKRVFSERVAREVVNMLEGVAKMNKRALVDGYRVGIKTGTAKKTQAGQKGYLDKYLAYTAGIAPLSKPRFSLVVMIDEPRAKNYYGGAVAAPVFSEIMGNVLHEMNIAPDNNVQPKPHTAKLHTKGNEQI